MRCNLAPGCISSDVKLCQRKPLFFGDPFFWDPFFLFFLFFLSPAKVGSLEMQPGAKLQAYLGVSMLQPHASTQRFRLRILRRTRSNAGRTSVRSLSGRIYAIWESPSQERASVPAPPRPATPRQRGPKRDPRAFTPRQERQGKSKGALPPPKPKASRVVHYL